MPHDVIMPALGMAQDTGLIIAWRKAPGDAVASDDVLFEVETDKSTMEVEAGADGFVAALLAEAGEEAPVGETIAVISAEKPSNPVRKSRAGGAETAPAERAPEPAPEPAPRPEPGPARPAAPAAKPAAPQPTDGRILASPKARRLALEQGLDLRRLAQAGHPQPYHAVDIDVLKAMPAETAGALQAASRRLTAVIDAEGFSAFAGWAAASAGLGDADALLAGLAAASLERDRATVAVERFGEVRLFDAPAGALGGVGPADPEAPADLTVRDLRMSFITSVELGPEAAPALTLTRSGDGLSITLECAADALSAAEATGLLSNFAGRMREPLRHLL